MPLSAEQVSDNNFNPPVNKPAYPTGDGPQVFIDEAHNNFHTADGRYKTFADLLRKDGYVVKGLDSKFTQKVLQTVDILVISNALADENMDNWDLPTPSAFSESEIQEVQTWVKEGGALLLIADHMPFPGAVMDMAASFGIIMGNGFAFTADKSGLMQFRRVDGSLHSHPIIKGRDLSEAVEFVISFTGQAFRLQPGIAADPLMVLGNETILMLPTQAWQFSEQTPRIGSGGMLQGTTLRYGIGRVAVFGEAAMFTAQVFGPQRKPAGMNHPEASQNSQFVLNILHWLSGLLTDE